jgi:hypothetical protein
LKITRKKYTNLKIVNLRSQSCWEWIWNVDNCFVKVINQKKFNKKEAEWVTKIICCFEVDNWWPDFLPLFFIHSPDLFCFNFYAQTFKHHSRKHRKQVFCFRAIVFHSL